MGFIFFMFCLRTDLAQPLCVRCIPRKATIETTIIKSLESFGFISPDNLFFTPLFRKVVEEIARWTNPSLWVVRKWGNIILVYKGKLTYTFW